MENGIYTDLSNEDYHNNDTHINSSFFRKGRKSLRHFKKAWDNKGKEEDQERVSCFDFGHAFEMALLQPDLFDKSVSIFDEGTLYQESTLEQPNLVNVRAGKSYKDGKNEFFNNNADKYIINKEGKESFETIQAMLEACYMDSTIKQLCQSVEYQTSVFWTDQETGLNLKIRTDLNRSDKNIIIDVKTAEDGSPEAFGRSIAKYDYPFQACMQIDGVIASGLMEKVDFYYWLVVEKSEPNNATLYEFAPDDIEYYMSEYEYIKGLIASAQKADKWTGYSQRADNKYGILTANIPLYYRSL